MSVPTKLAAFAVALAAAFGAGAAIGEAAGPIDVDGDDEHVVEHTSSTTHAPHPTAGDTTTTTAHDHQVHGGWG